MVTFRLFLACLFLVNVDASYGLLKLEVNQGQVKIEPIAVVDFYDKNGNQSEIGSEICSIIKNDLESSSEFKAIDESLFLEYGNDISRKGPNIKNWSVLNTRFLLYGKISSSFSGFDVDFVLKDIVTGKDMLSVNISGTKSKIRQVSHIIANYVYERITNKMGCFDTKIIYVNSFKKSAKSKRETTLVMSDLDGESPKELTSHSGLVLTPRYSRDGSMIAYILYNEGKGSLGKSPHVYIMNLRNNSTRLMINEKLMKLFIQKNEGNSIQMTYAPRFSNDMTGAVFSVIIKGKSAIYKMNFSDNNVTQLTQHTGIDTSPCFSPDDSKIVFTSNRAGKEAIYVMNSDGSDVHKISNGEGKYSQPAWSDRGDLIAFSKQLGREFFIGVMRPDGSGERLLCKGYMLEAPCWGPDGTSIAFTHEPAPGKGSRISIIDVSGGGLRFFPKSGDISSPAWSPITVSLRGNRVSD